MIRTKLPAIFFSLALGVLGSGTVAAQDPPPLKPPPPTAAPTPKLSVTLAKNLEQQKGTPVPREQRERAYAKMLEGQRYYWNANPYRSKYRSAAPAKLAKQSFLSALELDPTLSEAYTALAEIILSTDPGEIDEAIALANIAVKIYPDSFGARRILARVFTIKSNLRSDKLPFDTAYGAKATAEWKQVARLDPRNAEAWAFLSEFYDRLGKQPERIEALQKWLSSSSPIDSKFYGAIMGRGEALTAEKASLKLGDALIKANRSGEAIEILSRAVADDPENAEAIELLRRAVEDGGGNRGAPRAGGAPSNATLEALQQAVFANPGNLVLVRLLSQFQARTGQTDEAARSLRSAIARLSEADKDSAANLQVSLGDLYNEANRIDEAIAAYEGALKIQGIDKSELVTDDAREFATRVFGKMIQSYKSAGRMNEARAVIERARLLLGQGDLFAEGQMISLLRERGNTEDALQAVRALRTRQKSDYSLLQLEAGILTEAGRVEEGVALIRPLLGKGKTSSAPSLMYDDFNNHIFISGLYNQAKRGAEAEAAARQALAVADSEEKKQIAQLSLANAKLTSGDEKSAEVILRNLLKRFPDNPFALNNLGYFLVERNANLDEAVRLIRQALEIDPTNPSYLDSLGWAYFKLGKYTEAEFYLKEAISNDGGSATVYEHLGDVYLKQGKGELARVAWQKAMNLASSAETSTRIKDKLASMVTK